MKPVFVVDEVSASQKSPSQSLAPFLTPAPNFSVTFDSASFPTPVCDVPWGVARVAWILAQQLSTSPSSASAVGAQT